MRGTQNASMALMGTVEFADASFAKATCCHALHAASTSVTAVGSFNTCPIAACRVLEAGTISILGNNDGVEWKTIVDRPRNGLRRCRELLELVDMPPH